MFDINSLILEQVAFEVRYEQGYLYWDNCGKIWKDIFAKHPELKAGNVNVESATLVLEGEELTLNFSPTSIAITQKYPNSLKAYSEISDSVINIISKHLQIETFTRVGNRFFYFLKMEDSSEAIEFLRKTGFFSVSDEKVQKVGNAIINPTLRFTVTQDDDIGYIFNFKYSDRKIQFQIPKPIKYDASQFVPRGLSLDVDYYTMKAVDLSILRCDDLIKKNKKNIEYFFTDFFG